MENLIEVTELSDTQRVLALAPGSVFSDLTDIEKEALWWSEVYLRHKAERAAASLRDDLIKISDKLSKKKYKSRVVREIVSRYLADD